jgi:hypothetical protein
MKQKTSPKKSFNPEDKNTIIKIKGQKINGPGSLTVNRNECKNYTNPIGSIEANK